MPAAPLPCHADSGSAIAPRVLVAGASAKRWKTFCGSRPAERLGLLTVTVRVRVRVSVGVRVRARVRVGVRVRVRVRSHPNPNQVRHELGTKGLPSVAHELKIRDLSGGQKVQGDIARYSEIQRELKRSQIRDLSGGQKAPIASP